MRDGLARLRDRLTGQDPATGHRYVLLPGGSGRRRRLAEVGAVAGIAVVVLALVGATVALRPSSSRTPSPTGPGLPVPSEMSDGRLTVPPVPTSGSAPVLPPGRTGVPPSAGTRTTVPSGSASATATTPAPATTGVSATATTVTRTPTPPPVTTSPPPVTTTPPTSSPPPTTSEAPPPPVIQP